ncbi:L10-interacting MYB domain-containing protein [Cajanus cajan]|uniref:L10-interacting MYB domain-containing protein n=1 Tax=Cajanus cajan TaxID=3821 RepID=UPI00098DC0BC|nr:L10-interacting MYB domain-containing protein [Cajanus cajan]
MSNDKRKSLVDTSLVDNEGVKAKAAWDVKVTEMFVKLCLDQVYKGERNGTNLTKKGWKFVESEFNMKSGRKYGKSQFRNKWDNLKKEWLIWYKLFGKETGLGWDNVRNTVDASDEWWDKKQMENPLYGKFRYKGLAFANNLTTLFKDVVANEKFSWAPSSGILPNDIGEDDVYRPCFESGDINLEEGSGDSEEIIPTSAGMSSELRNINLSTFEGNNSERSIGKRKRVGASEKNESKKVKAPA